eukprot:GCRY01005105.1.p1 GENE.GCRY01005105.1~~GCRY01005105.1.p1  ORF type:complete len:625 (-),score=123.13 GCRY01005105.1:357-2048(-)
MVWKRIPLEDSPGDFYYWDVDSNETAWDRPDNYDESVDRHTPVTRQPPPPPAPVSLNLVPDVEVIDIPEIDDKKERFRQLAIVELINTEQGYVRDIKLIKEYFILPLKKQKVLSTKEINGIFSNLLDILKVQEEFLAKLLALVQKASTNSGKKKHIIEGVHQPFIDSVDSFEIYTDYLCNQENSLNQIDKLKEDSKPFEMFLAENLFQPELKQLNLFSYLIKPIQRICKYPLLLREIIKNTDESHPDYKALQRAMDAVEKKVSVINEQKRISEELLRVIEFCQSIQGCEKLHLLSNRSRRLISDTPAVLVDNDGSKYDGQVVLFSDLLLVARKNKRNRNRYPLLLVTNLPLTRAYCKTPKPKDEEFHIEDPVTNTRTRIQIAGNSEMAVLATKIVKATMLCQQESQTQPQSSSEPSTPTTPTAHTLGLTDAQRAALKKQNSKALPVPQKRTSTHSPHRPAPVPVKKKEDRASKTKLQPCPAELASFQKAPAPKPPAAAGSSVGVEKSQDAWTVSAAGGVKNPPTVPPKRPHKPTPERVTRPDGSTVAACSALAASDKSKRFFS